MVNDRRRRLLELSGLAGAASVTGLSGCVTGLMRTDDEGSRSQDADRVEDGPTGNTDGQSPIRTEPDGVDALLVLGESRGAVQLFRDYYAKFDDDDVEILVPDRLRDPSLPASVGNEMDNVTGVTPVPRGLDQESFVDLYREAYDEDPVGFAANSYDATALGILANAAAGENDGTAVRDQMRNVANPGGLAVGAGNFVEGVRAAANGEAVNYQGAGSTLNFDEYGDLVDASYETWAFEWHGTATTDLENYGTKRREHLRVSEPELPGGLGREVKVGVLLPQSGALATAGASMVDAALLPVRQTNRSDVDVSVDVQVEDTETNARSAVSAARSLVHSGYPFVCGSAASRVTLPVWREVLVPEGVVGCAPSPSGRSLRHLDDHDFVFRTGPSERLQAWALGRVAGRVFGGVLEAWVEHEVAFERGRRSFEDLLETVLSEPSNCGRCRGRCRERIAQSVVAGRSEAVSFAASAVETT